MDRGGRQAGVDCQDAIEAVELETVFGHLQKVEEVLLPCLQVGLQEDLCCDIVGELVRGKD